MSVVLCSVSAAAARAVVAGRAPEDANGDGLEDQEGGDGRRVTLTTDPTQDTFDRYGRLLAYVTTRAGVHLQTQQLSRGWGKVYVFDKPFQRVGRYRASRAARPSRQARRVAAVRRRLPPPDLERAGGDPGAAELRAAHDPSVHRLTTGESTSLTFAL
jgi:hypothetical protein